MTNRNKAKGTRFERRMVDRAIKCGLEASKQPGSGAIRGIPNDIVVSNWLGECKTYTDHPSMTKMLEWLSGVRANSVKDKREGGFLVYNQIGSRNPVVLLSVEDFFYLLANQLPKGG